MLTITGSAERTCDGMSRRNFLKVGSLISGGLTLPGLLAARGALPERASRRSAILIYLGGGPSHLETFDPKPDAPVEIRGPYRPIDTVVPGLRISETMPQLAKIADKFSLIRSCAHDNSGHGGGNRYVNTGYQSASPEFELPHDFPAIGSIVAKVRGSMSNGMPTYIRCPPSNEPGPAFLGNAFGPFSVYSTGKPTGLSLQPIIPLARMDDRRGLRDAFDTMQRVGDDVGRMSAIDDLERQAYEMISRPAARAAFEARNEPIRLRERYGTHPTGQSFLLARRFIEAGAGIVSVRMGSWDHHGNAGGTIKSGAEENNPPLDQSLSALISDLHDRGLSDDVLVFCWGEFGRTPRINASQGRDHWPQAMSVLMAGGGLKPGIVVGATNRKGEYPIDRAMTPGDILATVYRQLGIDFTQSFPASGNRPIQILNHGSPVDELI